MSFASFFSHQWTTGFVNEVFNKRDWSSTTYKDLILCDARLFTSVTLPFICCSLPFWTHVYFNRWQRALFMKALCAQKKEEKKNKRHASSECGKYCAFEWQVTFRHCHSKRCAFYRQLDLVWRGSETEMFKAIRCGRPWLSSREREWVNVLWIAAFSGLASFRGPVLTAACGSNICSLLEGDERGKSLLSPVRSPNLSSNQSIASPLPPAPPHTTTQTPTPIFSPI